MLTSLHHRCMALGKSNTHLAMRPSIDVYQRSPGHSSEGGRAWGPNSGETGEVQYFAVKLGAQDCATGVAYPHHYLPIFVGGFRRPELLPNLPPRATYKWGWPSYCLRAALVDAPGGASPYGSGGRKIYAPYTQKLHITENDGSRKRPSRMPSHQAVDGSFLWPTAGRLPWKTQTALRHVARE